MPVKYAGTVSTAVVVVLITYVSIVVGELVPSAWARPTPSPLPAWWPSHQPAGQADQAVCVDADQLQRWACLLGVRQQ
jgi:hypothetical protein